MLESRKEVRALGACESPEEAAEIGVRKGDDALSVDHTDGILCLINVIHMPFEVGLRVVLCLRTLRCLILQLLGVLQTPPRRGVTRVMPTWSCPQLAL